MAALTREPRRTVAGRRRPSRLTARLAIELFLLAVLITGACAWTAIALVHSALQKDLQQELAGMLDNADLELEMARRDVGDATADIKAYLINDLEFLEPLLDARMEELLDTAGVLMRRYQLDYLDLLDENGTVLSSGHQPERISLRDTAFEDLPTGRPVLRRASFSDQDNLTVLARESIEFGTRGLELVGGRILGQDFVDQVAGHQAALLVEQFGAEENDALTSPGAAGLRSALGRMIRDPAGNRPIALTDDKGVRWFVDYLPLDRSGAEGEAWLALAVRMAPFDALRRQMTNAFLLLGAGVGLIAALAGVWIARRTARPVRDLVAAFDTIASGEADYNFNIRAQDEIQELVSSFSRLHRALEDQRRRSVATERVAAWREVARHVAHEVKNPLAPIRLTVENLLRAKSDAPDRFDDLFREGMQTILEEVQQLSRMVSEFAEFARLPLPQHRQVLLEDLIERVVELYGSDPAVAIRTEFAPGLPPVELDADQVSRALKNVIGNAIEASRAEADRAEAALVGIRVSVVDEMVEIEVTDEGPGFSEEASRRIFEPYYTTKEHGVGLGMALTYRIIVEHGGVIFAENRKEGGARVLLRLPLKGPGPDVAKKQEAYA